MQVHIDHLLCHSAYHPEHLDLLDQVLAWLTRHRIKMNPNECVFGSPQVTYLGFELTPEGIKLRKDEYEGPKQCHPPSLKSYSSGWDCATSSELTFGTLLRLRHP